MPVRENLPLVTVGMPVRNGGSMFPIALESVLRQDYPNLEIVISDNQSDDGTARVIAEACERDARIRSIRPPSLLTAFGHFEFVMRQARGQYFLWAAHDDVRDADFVSRLVEALQAHPEAVLAFGDLHVTTEVGREGGLKPFEFDNAGKGKAARMRKAALQQCYHIYGVWRSDVLQRIPFIFNSWWPDLPIMVTAAGMGIFWHVPGVRFHYYEIPKTNQERAQYQDNSAKFDWRARVLRTLRLPLAVWRTASVVLGKAYGLVSVAAVGGRIVRDASIFAGRKLGLHT